MAEPGGPSNPSWERLRIAPRPVRAAPELTAPPPPPEPLPPPPLQQEEPRTPAYKPDRLSMDPSVLNRSSARRAAHEGRKEVKKQHRDRRGRKIDRAIRTALLTVVTLAVAGGVYWAMNHFLPAQPAPTAQAQPEPPSAGTKALAVWQAFAAAPDPAAKSAFVLDRDRVRPLMQAAYQKARIADHLVTPGVPQPLETGILSIPSQVADPSGILLHFMMREVSGEFLIDWETYDQEITQRFVGFASKPYAPAGEFRLILERAHGFEGDPAEPTYVRIAAPGQPAIAQPIYVNPEVSASLRASLPWNRFRRALVRLAWETPSGKPPAIILQEVVRWEFIP